jgi:hypothetical protein
MTYLGNSPGLTNYTVAVEKFTGTGACTSFQLAQNIADVNAIDVRVSSVPQDPTTAYTLAAGLITFTEAPPNAANNIVVTYRNTAVITYSNITTAQINDGAITASKLASGVGGDPAAGSYANSAFSLANGHSAIANSAAIYANGAFAKANTGGVTVSNDVTTTSNLFPIFAAAITGTISTVYTANNNYLYKPSTGELFSNVVVATNGIVINSMNVTANYTIQTGFSGSSVGPIVIANNRTVTVNSNSRWVVL